MATWQEPLTAAQKLLKESKHFDGVQKINSAMELFETEVGGSDSKILKEPSAFVDEFIGKLSDEQKKTLQKFLQVQLIGFKPNSHQKTHKHVTLIS